jgi:hypothetical protein
MEDNDAVRGEVGRIRGKWEGKGEKGRVMGDSWYGYQENGEDNREKKEVGKGGRGDRVS